MVYPREIERQYEQSAFVKEVCVLERATATASATSRLFAVVVPDLQLLRKKKIVNAGDLIRFEMEGQSIHLPPHQRVLAYDVWFDALPRTAAGEIDRAEVARRLEEREALRFGAGARAAAPWPDDDRTTAVVATVTSRARRSPAAGSGPTDVWPSDNLELDLGLDSMDRVELIAELEQRFGVRLSDEQTHQILTVRELVDAFVSASAAAPTGVGAPPWEVLLRDLPTASDPIVGPLVVKRPMADALVFALARVLRMLLARVTVTGLEHVPRQGPFIICPNHQGYLDPLFIRSVLPFRTHRDLFFVGAAEYFETPLTRWIARQLKLVPVDPDANLVPAMKAGAFGLTHGKVLMLFPEGERSIDGTVKRFKKGAAVLARHLRVPIVPVAIRGSFEVWPRNRAINWRLIRPWSGHRLRIAFLPPIRPDDIGDYGAAARELRQLVHDRWMSLTI